MNPPTVPYPAPPAERSEADHWFSTVLLLALLAGSLPGLLHAAEEQPYGNGGSGEPITRDVVQGMRRSMP